MAPDTLPIVGIAKRMIVEDVAVPWDFVPEKSTCSHQLLVQVEPGRYICEVCPAELLVRPLRKRQP
jgi:hypothetical protein